MNNTLVKEPTAKTLTSVKEGVQKEMREGGFQKGIERENGMDARAEDFLGF